MTRNRALGLGLPGVLVYVLWLGTRDFWYPGKAARHRYFVLRGP